VPGATLEVHYKLFGTDGVSLQSQELTGELRRRGWTVRPCASDVPDGAGGLRLDELAYQSGDAVSLRRRVFTSTVADSDSSALDAAGDALVEEIRARAEAIRRPVERYIDANGITLVHVRNIMSLPYNLPATVAIHALAVDRPDIGFLMQHHDLYWEGPNARNFATPFEPVRQLMERVMCPTLPNARHTVINPIAGDALRERKHIDATVIPDGFDFDRAVELIDDASFRGRLDILAGQRRPIAADDLVVAMPARVAINKSIELAIQLVAGLQAHRARLVDAAGGVGHRRRRFGPDSRVVLLLPQGEDLEDNREYFDRLVAYATKLRVTLAFGGNIVVPDRRHSPDDTDHYPFYSTYQAVDVVCYPPEHEGFGNQAIEAVWAQLPLAVFEYPVFQRYLRDHLPHYISLGDASRLGRLDGALGPLHRLPDDIVERAVDEAVTVLVDHEKERRWATGNVHELRAFCGIDVVAGRYTALYEELDTVTAR
jgi:hypothetical protein